MKNILKILPYIREQYGRLLTIMVASLIIAGITAIQPQIFKQIVDTVVAKGNSLSWADVKSDLILLTLLSAIVLATSYIFNIVSNRSFHTVRSGLHQKVFAKITSLSTDYFDTHRPGAIIHKNNQAIDSFASWINSLNYSLLGPIFTMIIVTIILMQTNLLIGLLGFGIIIYSSFEFHITRKRNRPANLAWRKHSEASSAIFSETIQNMTTISTLSSVNRFRNLFSKEQDRVLEQAFMVRDAWQLSGFRVSIFNELSFILAIIIIIFELIQGRLSAGTFVAVTAYYNSLRNNARAFAQFIPDTDRVENDVERLVTLLEEKPTFPSSPNAIQLIKLESLEFRNVSFAYPDSKKGAIENISFRIDKNNSIALVGPSGVGKSTITKLMLRFYAPTAGEILINDQPADTYTHESVRQHIGMVMQDVALFNRTIKENLKLANDKATQADLETAVEQAHAAEFIENLPKKYNTIVGERGIKLSGGQKQRVAIARAILKDPDLIILDEATSALDSESEKLVQDGLKKLMKGRLSLTIAHRLSTVRHADEILVLQKGTIVERGTHNNLIKKPRGLYKKLFELQSSTGKTKL
ncbi:ABC transporter ATP-binding protein [bacterium]|nr:MAG: ABC transporter ATP-binding protein [bacterium]